MNPFAPLVSPRSLAEAIAASAQLQGLPGYAYRLLDKERGPWCRQLIPLRPHPPGDAAGEGAVPP